MRIAALSGLIIIISLLLPLLTFEVQPAIADSRTFSSNATIKVDQTISPGEYWKINPGVTVTIARNAIVHNIGAIINEGNLIIDGTLINSGGDNPDDFGIENYASITINGLLNNTGRFHLRGDSVVDNFGTIEIIDGAVGAGGNVNNYAKLNIDGGILLMDSGSNFGIINNNAVLKIAAFINNGTIINNQNGVVEASTIQNFGILNNAGTFNARFIVNSGTILNKCDAIFSISGGLFGTPIVNLTCLTIQDLLEEIRNLDTSASLKNSLSAPLKQAMLLFNDGNPNNDGAGCGELDAFINQVNAKARKELTHGQAEQFLAETEGIADALGC